jgi:hypothetical protein
LAITVRRGKCLVGFHIRVIMVLNISSSVNKRTHQDGVPHRH